MNYIGIDLHSTNSVIVVSDETGRIVCQRRVPNELGSVLATLLPYREEHAGVVVESTYNWYWLVDGLQAAGYRVHLANTAAIKQYEGLKHSGDESDAAHLAQLLRLNILPAGYICPPQERALRDLARKRLQLGRSRTSHILSVENIMARQTGARIASRAVKALTEDALQKLAQPEDVRLAMAANVAVIHTLSAQIDKIEARLRERVKPRAEFKLLTSAPGIGEVLSTVIMLETGTIERFAAVGNFASYARLAWTANGSPTARKRAWVTSKMATAIWPGRLLRRPTSPAATAPRPSASMSASARAPTISWRPRHSRTSSRVPATTCSRRLSPSM